MAQFTTSNVKSDSRGYDSNSQVGNQKRPAARKSQGVAQVQTPITTNNSLGRIGGETGASNQLVPRPDHPATPVLPEGTTTVDYIEGPAVIPNILIFGETGAGKSSVLNMIAGVVVASVSGDAEGHTFRSTPYPVTIDSTTQVTFWDTAGLNEGEHGTVPAIQAMRNLQDLVGNMHGGVSLLVFCIRGSRFQEIWKINYDLFAGVICQSKVPVVLVVSGLENESPMENWWTENGGELVKRGMKFDGHACITSTLGKKLKNGEYMYQEEFEESKVAARKLVVDHCVGSPWVPNTRTWLSEIESKMARYYETESSFRQPEGRRIEARQQRGRQDANLAMISPIVDFFRILLAYLRTDSREVDSARNRDHPYSSEQPAEYSPY